MSEYGGVVSDKSLRQGVNYTGNWDAEYCSVRACNAFRLCIMGYSASIPCPCVICTPRHGIKAMCTQDAPEILRAVRTPFVTGLCVYLQFQYLSSIWFIFKNWIFSEAREKNILTLVKNTSVWLCTASFNVYKKFIASLRFFCFRIQSELRRQCHMYKVQWNSYLKTSSDYRQFTRQ